MDTEDRPYKFFSLAFHKYFLSKVLLYYLRPGKEKYRSPFSNHVPIEFMLLLAVSAILIAIGLPQVSKGSIVVGAIIAGLGVAGIITVFVISILLERGGHYYIIEPFQHRLKELSEVYLSGSRYSFYFFQPVIFFFFVMLGITAGLFFGVIYKSPLLGIVSSILGLCAGYGVGIYAGIWINYLGWIKFLFIFISFLAIAGMVVVDLVFLFGLIF